jgi:hypothetical protein
MKNKLIISGVMLAGVLMLSATQKDKTLKQALVFQIPAGSGTNGAGVAYNPGKKLYYAAFAGNTTYPITVFNAKGKLQKQDIEAGFDVRGFWYNAATNTLEGNGYGVTAGYYNKKLDASGIPDAVASNIFETDEYEEDEYQPDDNSVGAFIPGSDQIVFRSGTQLSYYGRTDGKLKRSAEITGLPGTLDDLTGYTVIYTGQNKMELGVLDVTNKKIYLINIATNAVTKTLALPKTAVVENNFNFAYCNGMYWLCNTKDRKWIAYK